MVSFEGVVRYGPSFAYPTLDRVVSYLFGCLLVGGGVELALSFFTGGAVGFCVVFTVGAFRG